jgi:xylulokinase
VIGDTFRTMCGCVPRTYVPESIMAAGTFILNWYIKEFGRREEAEGRAGGIPVTEVFEELAAGIGPGESRLLMLPYLKGSSAPSWDPFAKGVVLGLCESTTGAHFYRSIMEGIAFEQKFMYEKMEESLNNKINELVLLGGGAKSPLWRQIIADITGIPVLIPPSLETTCLGAGMLAAPAAGLYGSVFEASKGMSSISETCFPVEKNLSFYKKIYEKVYKLLFPRIRELVDEFTKLTSRKNLEEMV